MSRKRKHPVPRFLTVVSADPDEGARRCLELHEMAGPRTGRPYRVDHLREAMSVTDDIPPTPPWLWRKGRGASGQKIIPTRERRAVQRLIDIFADRGEKLTVENATRLAEQGRVLTNQARGITPAERELIEAARNMIGPQCSKGVAPVGLTKEQWRIVRRACSIVLRAPSVNAWDREFLRYVQVAMRHGALNSVIN